MPRRPRVWLRPTDLGLKGLLLFAALALAFLATNYSNLFFLVLAFSAVFGVFGAWWSLRNLRGLEVVAAEVPLAGAGAARALSFRVRASGRAPRFDVSVLLPLDGARPVAAAHTNVLAGDAPVGGELPGRGRGVEAFTHVVVESRYPFGMFAARTRVQLAGEVVTHPAPAASAGARRGGAPRDGDGTELASGRGAGLAGLRPFRTGDALADVHWKASARRGAPVVKERERERDRATALVLDRRLPTEALERALSAAAARVLDARTGAPLRLLSQGCDLRVDPDRGGHEEALRWLATADALEPDAAAPPRADAAGRNR